VQPTIFTLSAAGQLQVAGQPQVVNPPAQSETVTTEADVWHLSVHQEIYPTRTRRRTTACFGLA